MRPAELAPGDQKRQTPPPTQTATYRLLADIVDSLPDVPHGRIISGGTVVSTMSRYRRSSPRSTARFLPAVLGAALLAVSCTHAVPRAAARSTHGAGQALYLWPAGQPLTYNDIACGGAPACTSGFTGSVPPALRRPLHLPALVHGKCPVHRARVVEPHIAAAEGPGPIYPVIADNAGPSGALTFAYPPPPGSYRAGSGFGGQKILWTGAPSYRGPVLIRGGQLGGHDPVKFDTGTRVLFPELQFPPQSRSARPGGGWRNWPSGTDLRASGCYAWQIDGTTFSYTVVFKAVQTR